MTNLVVEASFSEEWMNWLNIYQVKLRVRKVYIYRAEHSREKFSVLRSTYNPNKYIGQLIRTLNMYSAKI